MNSQPGCSLRTIHPKTQGCWGWPSKLITSGWEDNSRYPRTQISRSEGIQPWVCSEPSQIPWRSSICAASEMHSQFPVEIVVDHSLNKPSPSVSRGGLIRKDEPLQLVNELCDLRWCPAGAAIGE
jgi:hypothetical protein